MDRMQVILGQNLPNLGKVGDVVSVRNGYGRNYLIPQGLAVLATSKNLSKMEHDKKVVQARAAKLQKDVANAAQKLKDVTLQIERQVGQDDKLFGSVTSRDIEEALRTLGIVFSHKNIHLDEPIKHVGQYNVTARLGQGVTQAIKVWVVAKS